MKTIKESFVTFTSIFKFGQKRAFNKKLITLKLQLDETLSKADTMFAFLEILNKNRDKDKEEIKNQFTDHLSRIRSLQNLVNDLPFQSMLSSYAPVLKTQLNTTIGSKSSPISIFLRKFDPNAQNQIFLSEVWDEKNLKESKFVVSELKMCLNELNEFIKQHIELHDVLSYQHK